MFETNDTRCGVRRGWGFGRRAVTTVLVSWLLIPAVVATTAGTTSAVFTTTPSCIASPTDFANAFLNAIPAPDTSQNVEAIVAWENREGGNWHNDAHFNPLGDTRVFDGSVSINSKNVQSYNSWNDGVQATVATINGSLYTSIISALDAGNNATAVLQAVGASKWGTPPDVVNLLGQPYDPPDPAWQPACTTSGTATGAVAVVRNPAGSGYWILAANGGVFSYGGAPFEGSAAGQSYFAGQTAVAMAAAPSGTGYWILSASGGVYAYNVASHGAAAGQSYFAGQTAVSLWVDPAGTGYVILAASGGTYAYNAPNYGSAAGQGYFAGQTAVQLVGSHDGKGFYILARSGGVYAYGDAASYGSAAGQSYFAGQRAVAMSVDAPGTGYWILSASGGIYSFGNPGAPFYGSASGQSYFAGRTAASLASTADGGGYWILSTAAKGDLYSYGDATYSGSGAS
jgi:hypothetical protein